MADWSFEAKNSIIDKYVKSLYGVAVSVRIEKVVEKQLTSIKDLVLSMRNRKKYLEMFSLIPQYGEAFILQLKNELKLSKEVGNFLALLLKNKRLSLIAEICSAYLLFIDRTSGKKVFLVTHATDFSRTDKKQLGDNLYKVFGGKIEFVSRKDPSLIDGIKIQFHSKILDYSMKSRLTRLRHVIQGRQL